MEPPQLQAPVPQPAQPVEDPEEEDAKERLRDRIGFGLFLIACLLILLVPWAYYWEIIQGRMGAADRQYVGFDGLATAFSGLAFAAVFYAILLQRKELKLQREELKRSVLAQEKASAAMMDQLLLQTHPQLHPILTYKDREGKDRALELAVLNLGGGAASSIEILVLDNDWRQYYDPNTGEGEDEEIYSYQDRITFQYLPEGYKYSKIIDFDNINLSVELWVQYRDRMARNHFEIYRYSRPFDIKDGVEMLLVDRKPEGPSVHPKLVYEYKPSKDGGGRRVRFENEKEANVKLPKEAVDALAADTSLRFGWDEDEGRLTPIVSGS